MRLMVVGIKGGARPHAEELLGCGGWTYQVYRLTLPFHSFYFFIELPRRRILVKFIYQQLQQSTSTQLVLQQSRSLSNLTTKTIPPVIIKLNKQILYILQFLQQQKCLHCYGLSSQLSGQNEEIFIPKRQSPFMALVMAAFVRRLEFPRHESNLDHHRSSLKRHSSSSSFNMYSTKYTHREQLCVYYYITKRVITYKILEQYLEIHR